MADGIQLILSAGDPEDLDSEEPGSSTGVNYNTLPTTGIDEFGADGNDADSYGAAPPSERTHVEGGAPMEPVQVVVPLEEGKEFHLFLAHSTENRAIVEVVLETLEDEPYNLKCCYSARDLTAGVDVLENLERAIVKSCNVALFLSEAFMESEYCKLEKRMAESQQCAGQSRVIPVLLEECKLPRNVRMVHYIDARGAQHDKEVFDELVSRLVRAVMHGPNPDEMLQLVVNPVPRVPRDRNGSVLCLEAETGRALHRSQFSSVFVELKTHEKEKMDAMGLEVSSHIMDQMFTVVNTTAILRHHKLLFKGTGWMLIALLICSLAVTLAMGLGSLVMLLRKLDDSLITATAVVGISIVVTIAGIASWITIFVLRRKYWKEAEVVMKVASRLLQRNHQFVASLLLQGPDIFLMITKLDTSLCKAYIGNNLLTPPNSSGQNPDGARENDELIAQQCDQIIYDAIPGYLEVLTNRRLTHQATVQRHPMVGDLVCVCQYVEINRLHIARPRQACELDISDAAMNQTVRRRRGYGRLEQSDAEQPVVV